MKDTIKKVTIKTMEPMEEFMFENWYGLTVKGLVPIYEDAEEAQYVVARELYDALKLKTPYRLWARKTVLKERTEGKDFWELSHGQKKEHILAIDEAIEIARKSRSEKGEEVFLWLEQKSN